MSNLTILTMMFMLSLITFEQEANAKSSQDSIKRAQLERNRRNRTVDRPGRARNANRGTVDQPRRNRHSDTVNRAPRRNDHVNSNINSNRPGRDDVIRRRRNHARRDADIQNRSRNRSRNYRTNTHIPYRRHVNHSRRWYNSRDYFRTVSPRYVYRNFWLRVTLNLLDGYHYYDNYPYFVYRGYGHRYSSIDLCRYELVDSYTDSANKVFSTMSCSVGYDQCASIRDNLNMYEYGYRYFCSERSDTRYSSDYDYNNDGYDDYFGDDDYMY